MRRSTRALVAVLAVAVTLSVGTRPSAAPGPGEVSAKLGEIVGYAGATAPPGWILCQGQLLAIADYPQLFAVIGTSFGGDGATTFGVPDMRGRSPMGAGAGSGLTNRTVGQEPGAEAVILDVTQLPSHDHTLRATNSAATQTQPAGNILATAATPQFLNASTSVVMGSDSIGASGSNAPHANIQPNTVINFIISVAPPPVVDPAPIGQIVGHEHTGVPGRDMIEPVPDAVVS